ncbi:hypothetical protein NKH77_43645 [Streptomyces sp. M19]
MSLTPGTEEPSEAFRAVHPRGVFHTTALADRLAQLDAAGFTDVARRDLTDWAVSLLADRLKVVRIFRGASPGSTGARRRTSSGTPSRPPARSTWRAGCCPPCSRPAGRGPAGLIRYGASGAETSSGLRWSARETAAHAARRCDTARPTWSRACGPATASAPAAVPDAVSTGAATPTAPVSLRTATNPWCCTWAASRSGIRAPR